MFYLPPSELWYFAVARLTVVFDDNIEEHGTGFFIDDGISYYLVTARHVVDAYYRPPDKRRKTIAAKVSASFLLFDVPGATGKVGMASGQIEIKLPTLTFDSEQSDCAIVGNIILRVPRPERLCAARFQAS